ncbi:MAG: hypothetical protein UH654_08560, partial [Lachnospiraceae bacterium]|nr:hypothetical protein [Lachnospiraceae bacterium]
LAKLIRLWRFWENCQIGVIITEVGLQRILYDAIYVAGSKKLRLLQVGVVHKLLHSIGIVLKYTRLKLRR